MKSLKYETSIPQVSKDYLLNIQKQPENTCPLINSLQFTSHNSTRSYKVLIEEEPDNLEVDSHYLTERIETLERWANNIIDLYYEIDEDILEKIDEDTKEDIVYHIEEIKKHIGNNYNYEIKDMEKSINKIIDDWKDETEAYNELKSEIEHQESHIESLEREIDNLDDEDEKYEDNLEDLTADVKSHKDDLENMKSNLEDKEIDFRRNIERDFENEVFNFSIFLEKVRTNNDEMRQESSYVRGLLYPFYEAAYNLKQPMDYLKDIEMGTEKEISLGVIYSGEHLQHFNRLCTYLEKNQVINKLQSQILCLSQRKDDLFRLLTLKGYTTIRYYENRHDYIKNPDDYKVYKAEELKIEDPNIKNKTFNISI